LQKKRRIGLKIAPFTVQNIALDQSFAVKFRYAAEQRNLVDRTGEKFR
jgi:hypothetical protein